MDDKLTDQMALGDKVLALPLDPENGAKAKTIREYLCNLAHKVWLETEGFSGKRPWGDSDWDCDIYFAIARAGMIKAEIDEDGDVEWDGLDTKRADRLMEYAFVQFGSSYT